MLNKCDGFFPADVYDLCTECPASEGYVYTEGSDTSSSFQGHGLPQISKWLLRFEWWMASGVMYGCCFPPCRPAWAVFGQVTSASRACPWSPNLLSGCKYDPRRRATDTERWVSLWKGRKSDRPRFAVSAFCTQAQSSVDCSMLQNAFNVSGSPVFYILRKLWI